MTDQDTLPDQDDTIAFFEGVQQAEILSELEKVYNHRHGLALITAPLGAGVTTIIKHFGAILARSNSELQGVSVAIIDAADNTVGGFLAEILEAFGYQIDDARQSELLSLATMICKHQTIAGRPPLIAFEHIDHANPKILALVNELASVRYRNESICRIILTGGELLKDVAEASRMGEVKKRICATLELKAMDDQELRAFVAHMLSERKLSAHASAVDSLVRLSNGLPGDIIRAIDYASREMNKEDSLSSGDVLLAIESGQPEDVERPFTATATTQIQKITMQAGGLFNEGQPTQSPREPAPLGEILVNNNGELLQRYVISRRKVLIGRAPHNDIVLESRWVSRHHAILICSPDKASLADVNSTNGLTLNSRELRQAHLRHNDIIVIGDFRLKYINEHAKRPAADDNDPLRETRVLRSLGAADLGSEATIKVAADKPAAKDSS